MNKVVSTVDFRLAHKAPVGSSTCKYCNVEHDDHDIGPCPAFSGVRSPMAGEKFIGLRGNVEVARFDFTEQKFAVLK